MKKCTDTVTDWLIQNETIEETERELYEYAVFSAIWTLAPLLLTVVIGFCMGRTKKAIVMILPFMLIRKFGGGYHSKSLWKCLLMSCLLLFLCIGLTSKFPADWKLAAATSAAVISLMIFSPLDNENRRLEQDEKRDYKKYTTVLVLIFTGMDLLLFGLGQYEYAVCIAVGIQLSAGLQLPCIIKKLLQRPETA